MNEPLIEFGGYEPPKAHRMIPGLDDAILELMKEPGRWGQVNLPGYTGHGRNASGSVVAALKRAGCQVVTRNGGRDVHACWPREEE